jgi:hypothetical protein
MAIGDQASHNVDETVDRTAMTSMLNLRDVLELIDDAFNDSPFAQEQFVHPGQQAVLHVLSEFGDELHAEGVEALFKEWLRDLTPIGDQLTKPVFAERWNWRSIIDMARGDLASQEFTTPIDDQMQFEPIKPAHRTLAALSELGKHPVIMNAMIITN